MKKLIFVISLIAVSGFLFGSTAPEAKAQTIDELQVSIQQLQTQIAEFQEQLQNLTPIGPAVWCHNFNVNLRIGDSGSEVQALQTALSKEGLYTRKITGIFDEYTASAVVGFQEKYASEALAPWGLTRGTGYVGSTTRAKLNKLYGCGVVKRYIKVFSPNGGEKWVIGNTYEIQWKSAGIEKVDIILLTYSAEKKQVPFPSEEYYIAREAEKGSYNWSIPAGIDFDIYPYYKIYIEDSSYSGGPEATRDISDNYFSITKGKTCHTSPLWSWDYCSPTCQCSAGEGDCDTNADCTTGYCAMNVGTKYGQVSTMDVCEKAATTITCKDSDGGRDYFIKGTATRCETGGTAEIGGVYIDTQCIEVTDTCVGSTVLKEYYCENELIKSVSYTCSYGCKDGACQAGITVISPDGGEKWTIGKTYDINWASEGTNYSTVLVNIYLWRDGNFVKTIALGVSPSLLSGSPSIGKYSWTVPSGLTAGDKYQIRLYASGIAKSDFSDNYFSIVKSDCHTSPLWSWDYCSPTCQCYAGEGDCDTNADCTTGYCAMNVGTKYGQVSTMDVCEEKAEKSIAVISPNGGEKWVMGNAYDIVWESKGLTENVEIYIRDDRAGPSYKLIATNILNSTHRYTWKISNDFWGPYTAGDYCYKIQVREIGGKAGGGPGEGIFDESDNYFSIVKSDCHTSPLWSWDYCSPTCQCYAGEGDCDTNADCTTGYCAQNVGVKYGQVSTMDACEEKEKPSITISSTPPADINGNVTIKQGDQITITGVPSNLSGQMGVDYTRAFFFDSIFNNSCSNTDWVMTCTANQVGTSNFYIKVYKSGQTYQSNIIKVTVVASSPSITVISPSGGETWTVGKTYNITWAGGDNVSSFPVYLRGGTLGSSGKYIGGAYASQKVFSWTISSDIAADSGYYIQFGIAPTMVLGTSKTFTIVSGTTTPSVTVISPNGGEKWEIGKTYEIKWTATGFSGTSSVQIGIYNVNYSSEAGLCPEYTIVNTVNTGKYQWTAKLPWESCPIGSGYKIKVYVEGGGPGKFDESDNYFSIIAATATEEILVPGYNFYVKTSDTGTGNWSFAKSSCEALGSGWTLPTMAQLRILYQKKNEIGGFKDQAYWSSEAGQYIHFSNGFESSMNTAMTFPAFRCVKKADGVGLKTIENQLASLNNVVSRLIEQVRDLLER